MCWRPSTSIVTHSNPYYRMFVQASIVLLFGSLLPARGEPLPHPHMQRSVTIYRYIFLYFREQIVYTVHKKCMQRFLTYSYIKLYLHIKWGFWSIQHFIVITYTPRYLGIYFEQFYHYTAINYIVVLPLMVFHRIK